MKLRSVQFSPSSCYVLSVHQLKTTKRQNPKQHHHTNRRENPTSHKSKEGGRMNVAGVHSGLQVTVTGIDIKELIK
jgi:hypothetical protein